MFFISLSTTKQIIFDLQQYVLHLSLSVISSMDRKCSFIAEEITREGCCEILFSAFHYWRAHECCFYCDCGYVLYATLSHLPYNVFLPLPDVFFSSCRNKSLSTNTTFLLILYTMYNPNFVKKKQPKHINNKKNYALNKQNKT